MGSFRPEEIGPIDVQSKNGVVDIIVADEAEAVAVAKQYIAYFQGDKTQWEAADQTLLRNLIAEKRRRIYDVRKIITTMADRASFLELRLDSAC